ncbi:sugar phosphate isomerase/epimerase family protein [Candidatus Omnitrophota bacterium]
MLAISTAWKSDLGPDIKAILSCIKETGFDAIELGYNFTQDKLQGIIPLLSDMNIKVVSVHNFCPLPYGVRRGRFATDYYRLSSLNERERRKAVEYTKATIDTALSVYCPIIVMHAGTVEFSRRYIKKLLNLYNQGKRNSGDFLKVRDKILSTREAKKAPHLDSLDKSLREVLSYAHSVGVRVGLETRYYPNEIPNIEEAEVLLSRFSDRGLVYWHDVGHAEVNERFGITAHSDYLRKFAHCIAGMHLHDIKGIDDHLAPFSGEFDFSKLSAYMQDSLIKVIEAHPPATSQEIKKAIAGLQ